MKSLVPSDQPTAAVVAVASAALAPGALALNLEQAQAFATPLLGDRKSTRLNSSH